MKTIGIMGGTFDPIHVGHLIAAQAALNTGRLDEVWFIPTYDAPLKEQHSTASASHRLEMVTLAIEDNPQFKVNNIEQLRGGTSYSIDTVTALVEQYPDYAFSYIIGSDRINDLVKWHRIEQLAELVTFIGLERPSDQFQWNVIPDYLRVRISLADMPLIGISSTNIRQKLSRSLSVRYEVPDQVLQYIRRHKLYVAE
ncbi:nicotinate-nucleotide adenylyltransferase [Paenibacillus yanchengensis]|uniref:Probable nicotinate-nucleotide adenylyltransferase n=1 Tax=Paenibacillus yanchengensis TaxID=2035833 RepID=A0ABW4YKV3_9BACL